MPLKLEITVGDDKFNLDGDFTIDAVVPALKEWGRLIGLPPGQAEIDQITDRVSDSTERLHSAVESNQPAAPTLKDA